jgi:hypothetical protein
MFLGAINGLVGLNLSGSTNGEVLWGALAGLMLFVYVVATVAPIIARVWKRNHALSARDIKVTPLRDARSYDF